jgi:pyrimidine/purine-5'-nucleotide nucleosidase
LVAGNVKAQGIKEIKKRGPFSIKGDREIMAKLDALLAIFAKQNRMKLPGTEYVPCYELVL